VTATLTTPIAQVTEPGVYDLPDAAYHADPIPGGSLSSTGARRLLPPSCPALFKYERDHGRPEKRAFDFGHAAHQLVLGVGPEIVTVEADDWRTKAAKETRDAAYATGSVPLLAAEWAQVEGMAAALREHPYASALFDPARGGAPEQSLFWQDGRFDVWRRARLDWLPRGSANSRMIVADYKSTVSAEPSAFRRASSNYGYHQQAAFYTDAVQGLGLADDITVVFVAQEKTPPYLITVFEPDAPALRVGRHLNDQALGVFAECQATGVWPGYSTDVELLSLPPWVANRYLEMT
jgi:hypothetical protein